MTQEVGIDTSKGRITFLLTVSALDCFLLLQPSLKSQFAAVQPGTNFCDWITSKMMFDSKNNLTYHWRIFPGKTCVVPHQVDSPAGRSHDRSGVCWGRYVICQTLLWYIGCLKNSTLCLPRGFFFCHHFISNESAHSVQWSPQWCLHLVVLVPLMAPNCFSLGSTRGSITMPTNVNTQPCVQVTVLRV